MSRPLRIECSGAHYHNQSSLTPLIFHSANAERGKYDTNI